MSNEQDARFSQLITEQANPSTAAIDRMNPLEIVQAMNTEDALIAGAVAREQQRIAQAIEAIATRLRRGGRLLYFGAGTSGRLGMLDAVECPPTFNSAPELVQGVVAGGSFALSRSSEKSEDDESAGRDDVERMGVREQDAVVGVTASGHTPYVLGALAASRERGALTIGVACNTAPPLFAQVDIPIAILVGPEVIAGSTRLKAGTAQKMVLNMLSTATMVLLGKTYGNLMVDVQATNSKLRERALGIVCQTTGLDRDAAVSVLAACAGETKTVILVTLANLTPAAARTRLAEHGGMLHAALAAQP